MPRTDPAREALLTALEAAGVLIPLWDGIMIEETVTIAPGATILPDNSFHRCRNLCTDPHSLLHNIPGRC